MGFFVFKSALIKDWLRDISSLRNRDLSEDGIVILFTDLNIESIHPQHIASLACLLEHWYNKNQRNVRIDCSSPVGEYLFNKLKIQMYWKGDQNYADSESPNILNLWRIKDEEKEVHGRRVSQYLKQTYFHNKDLSAVENSLTEAYYNIFDHAQAGGNAFTMLEYDERKGVLHVAVCDFGIGIAKSVQNFLANGIDDKSALAKAIEANFTIKSASYNAGQGLSNIIDSCTERDSVCICSNSAVLTIKGSKQAIKSVDYSFEGTLLFYSMAISRFDDEETLDELIW